MKTLPISSNQYDISRYGLTPELPEVFDASMLKEYVDCPSSFYLRHVLGLRQKGPEKPHFAWGRRWHEAMYILHDDWDLGAAIEAATREWPAHLDDEDRKGRTMDRMVQLLVKYVEKYAELDQKEWRTVRREMYFDVDCPEDADCSFGGCGLRWCGRMDGIFERLTNEKVNVRDYKTTTFFRQSTWTQLQHGFQIPGYVWAANHLIPTRLLGAHVDLKYLKKASEEFYRREIRFNIPQIIEWRDNVKRIVAEIRERFERYPVEPWAWPKNWNNCEKLWPCDFLPVHYTPDIRDTRLMIMEQEYVMDRWDPSEIMDE